MANKKQRVARSAITGRFVKLSTALRWPKNYIIEVYNRRKKK